MDAVGQCLRHVSVQDAIGLFHGGEDPARQVPPLVPIGPQARPLESRLRRSERSGEDAAMSSDDDGVAAAIEGELRLMDPAVRASRVEAERFLDPHFTEVGSSGRRWNRAEILAELPEMQGAAEDGPRYRPSHIAGVEPVPGMVHLSYETDFDGLRARRNSFWRRGEDGRWRMYHHQATPVPAETRE